MRRTWLAAAAIGIGIGAALAIGSGVAAADTGPSGAASSHSRPAASAPSQSSTTPGVKRASQARASIGSSVPRLTKTDAAPSVSRAKAASIERSSARSAAKLAASNAAPTAAVSAPSTGVTGVTVGHSDLDIPVGAGVYTGAADWYFPTQADGSVQAQGVIYLQHGFLGDKSWYSALATQQAQQTNSIVVVPNVPSFPFFTCSGCTLNSVQMQQGVAELFVDPTRSALNTSATAAGYDGVLPEQFILSGHSAGGGLAVAAGGFYSDAVAPDDNSLLGVVMYDGVSNSSLAPALASLGDIPVYTIAAPPQPWNANGQTTTDLVASRPGQFVGDTLANGSHVDSLIGGVPLIDFVSQLFIRWSPPGNTAAVYTLSTGWMNDFYAGRGPSDPLYGIYGEPDQYIVMGPTAAVVLGPAPIVDVDDYLGTWYEVGSVKQFFSLGLVNTTAVYSLNPDGSIKVVNSGNYFADNGPESTIVGTALPVDPANNKLNVTFFGPASDAPPGNYWIVDLAPDYSWAIVSDSTGSSGFLLSRTPTVTDDLYQQLLNRASVKGVRGWLTPTRQPQAAPAARQLIPIKGASPLDGSATRSQSVSQHV
jgi:lipocalin